MPKTQAEPKPETDSTNGAQPELAVVSIPFRGHTFTIPRDMDDWETEACIAMSQSEYVLAAKLILGTAQWAVLQSLGSKRKDIREFLAVFGDAVSKECIS